MIERQNFITDLFKPINILNNFNDIEFESFKSFLVCIAEDFLLTRKTVRVSFPIRDVEEFKKFIILSTERYFCESISVNLLIKKELLKDIFELIPEEMKYKRFSITTDNLENTDFKLNEIKGFLQWTKYNRLIIKLNVDYNNYKDIQSIIVRNFRLQGSRFFDLSFNYESFEEMKFEEFHLLEFWLNQIIVWMWSSQDIQKVPQPIIINNTFIDRKHLFVSNDIKLYLTRQAYEEGEILFDLLKNKKSNGSTIPMKELNKFLQYEKLNKDVIIPHLNNHSYVDYYQNLKIMGMINELPIITRLIGEILDVK